MAGQPSVRVARAHAGATLLIGLVLTLVIASLAFDIAEGRAEDRFAEESRQTANAIGSALRNSIDELRDVGAFVATARPTKAELSEYVAKARVFDEFDGIVGLMVLERVPEPDLARFVADKRTEDPAFTVVTLGEHPVGMPHYILTHYVPGGLGVELPIGVDVSALATVRYELEPRSMTGDAVAGAVQNEPLIREAARQLSSTEYGELFRRFDFLLAVPAYANGARPRTGAPASAWVAAPVGKFENILGRSLDGQPRDLGVSLRVDIDHPALAGLNIENVAQRANPTGTVEDASFRQDTSFETDGLRWSITLWSSPTAGDPPRQLVALVLALGAVAAMVSAIAVYLRVRSKARDLKYRRLMHVHERERLQRDVLASVSEAVVILDSEGRVVVGNGPWQRLVERAGDMAAPPGTPYTSVLSLMSEVDTNGVTDQIGAVIAGAEQGAGEISIGTGQAARWFELLVTPLHGESPGAVIVHRDVTDQRRVRTELQRRADRDPMTGLLNRAALERDARVIVGRARDEVALQTSQGGAGIGALFIDLDAFKAVNDTYGHAAGDQVLRTVAARIDNNVRDSDLVGRQGGDEFVVVLNQLSSPDQAEDLAHRLLYAIRQPMSVAGRSITVNASIGLVVLDDPSELSVAKLLSLADKAMYDAKATGGATFKSRV